MMDYVLKTNRLFLQPLCESDFEFIHKLCNTPEYFEFECENAYTSDYIVERCKWYIDSNKKLPNEGAIQWIVTNKDIRIGEVHVWCNFSRTHDWEIGWHFLHEYWDKGFATEATKEVIKFTFSNFNINRIMACPNAANTRSSALCERIGMTKEGRLREVRIINNIYFDEDIYSILKREVYTTV